MRQGGKATVSQAPHSASGETQVSNLSVTMREVQESSIQECNSFYSYRGKAWWGISAYKSQPSIQKAGQLLADLLAFCTHLGTGLSLLNFGSPLTNAVAHTKHVGTEHLESSASAVSH